jgi:hypothetical protein
MERKCIMSISESDFWTVQLIYGYEFIDDADYDNNLEGWVAGIAAGLGSDGPTFVFFEVLRDLAAHNPLVGAEVSYQDLLERTSLHEVAHRFDMRHFDGDGLGSEGVLDVDVNLSGTDAENVFTLRQLARIQATDHPR